MMVILLGMRSSCMIYKTQLVSKAKYCQIPIPNKKYEILITDAQMVLEKAYTNPTLVYA